MGRRYRDNIHGMELMRNIRLFSQLSDQELSEVLVHLQVREFKKNAVILAEEETNEYMYIILKGSVKVVRLTEEGREIMLAIHQGGEFFGEVALIDSKTLPAMVMATEESLIATISKKQFFQLIADNKKLLHVLLQILCGRLRESWNRVQMLSFTNASQRIRMLFLLLSGKYGKQSDDWTTLDIKLTHQDIANLTGLTRETATRIIDRFREDGEIQVQKNRYVLGRNFLDVSELKHMHQN